MSYCPKDVEMIIRPHNRKIIGKGEVGYIFPKISLTLLRWLSYRFLSWYRPYSKPLIFKTSLLTLIHLSAIWSFIKSHFHICMYTNTHILYKCMYVYTISELNFYTHILQQCACVCECKDSSDRCKPHLVNSNILFYQKQQQYCKATNWKSI